MGSGASQAKGQTKGEKYVASPAPLQDPKLPVQGPAVLVEAWHTSQPNGTGAAKPGNGKTEHHPPSSWTAGGSLPSTSPGPSRSIEAQEAEKREVLEVLQTCRLKRCRQLAFRLQRYVAETAVVEELAPGLVLDRPEAWFEGTFIVLSGQASVLISPSCNPGSVTVVPEEEQAVNTGIGQRHVQVAHLKRGDSFGWHVGQGGDGGLSEDDKASQDAWVLCNPRIVVGSGRSLRFFRLAEVGEESANASRGRGASRGHGPHRTPRTFAGKDAGIDRQVSSGASGSGPSTSGVTAMASDFLVPSKRLSMSRLAQLWLTTTPPPLGLAQLPTSAGGALPRAHFQAGLWTPFQDRLDDLLEEIRRRQRAKYRIHDCFPLQGRQIVELKNYIMHLTEVWYGSSQGGNLSVLYAWFVEAMGVLGVTAYSYDALPIEDSADGWTKVVDGEARRAALQGKGNRDSAYAATGGVPQKQGRSAIDNTVLRNHFNPWEAREMLTGRVLRKILCKLLRIRQRCVLRRLSHLFHLDLLRLASQGGNGRIERTVRAMLSATPDEEIEACGINTSGPAFQLLKSSGKELAGFGQLDAALQKRVWEVARVLLAQTATSIQQVPPENSPPDTFARFVAWTRDYPGEYFDHDKQRHALVLMAGLFSGRVVVVKRSAMERMTMARYFPLAWKRHSTRHEASEGPKVARVLLAQTATSIQQVPPENSPPDTFARFVAWTRDYPGEYFDHDKQRHALVLMAGLFSGRVVVVKRSAMERMTMARYFPLAWKRKQPLWGNASTGHFQVRAAGIREGSHVRANECPYSPLHGMSLSAGGFVSEEKNHRHTDVTGKTSGYTILMEMQWIKDPQANIENWYITDIEKIVQEAWQLNPHGPPSMMLPGETFVAVGQNPKVGSSIRQTQHTQLARGSWKCYPVLHLPATSAFVCKELEPALDSIPLPRIEPIVKPGVQVRHLGPASLGEGAVLEVVDIGPSDAPLENCGTMLRIRLRQPASHGLLRFLIQLRLRILERLGTAEVLDFLVLCMSDDEGGFVVIFAPIPQLVKLQEGHADLVPWANPLTGESSESAGIEESRLDFGKAVGHFLVLKQELREQLLENGQDTLLKIWAFNRVPGARAVIDDFIVEEGIVDE
eukprot:TRINITY_DN18825_c1_g1_i2.p1 TRINITY_DN18825_c1_g1~~TRINITY_DN18825_c1_g1_i2.p1  ORF type:complete len:1143 (-),score=216.98 TRINITY_DN18825_c1_g1_i2:60-3446(-)